LYSRSAKSAAQLRQAAALLTRYPGTSTEATATLEKIRSLTAASWNIFYEKFHVPVMVFADDKRPLPVISPTVEQWQQTENELKVLAAFWELQSQEATQ
jgi:hypothetical protein